MVVDLGFILLNVICYFSCQLQVAGLPVLLFSSSISSLFTSEKLFTKFKKGFVFHAMPAVSSPSEAIFSQTGQVVFESPVNRQMLFCYPGCFSFAVIDSLFAFDDCYGTIKPIVPNTRIKAAIATVFNCASFSIRSCSCCCNSSC